MCPSPEIINQSGGINITAPIGRVDGDIVGRDKIGLDEEKLVAVLEARGFLRTAEAGGLERRTIIELARRLNPEDTLDFDQAIRELERAVGVALDVIMRGEQGTNEDDFVNTVLERVAEQTRTGDLDGGASTIDRGLAELDATYRRSRIALIEEGVKVDTLRRDASAVAMRIEALITVDQPTKRSPWLPAFRERYEALLKDGEEKGINFSLSVAIKLARRMVATANDDTERGIAAILLGTALWTLGEREAGTVRLEEALVIYREALQEWRRERAPLAWAMMHNSLGNALWKLGEREAGTERLEEAVSAFHNALQEWTRESMPFKWAMAQNNLGTVLLRLSEREAGTERLEEAVTAFHNALQEWTRESAPLEWAMAQNNLGSAFWTLGRREKGTARLEKAVTAFHNALQEWTRERAPLQWAMAQNNLGNALQMLGEREAGTARLEEAVTAYHKALQEWTRERMPFNWAMAQNNLGNTLQALGEREAGTARLEEAVTAYHEALQEWTCENALLYWAMSTGNQGITFMFLADRLCEASMANLAVEQINVAFKTMRQGKHVPLTTFYEARLFEALALFERLVVRGHVE